MQIFGFSIEDWAAFAAIAASLTGALIWGFKKAFHSVYEQESGKHQEQFDKLVDTLDDFQTTQVNLNRTMQEIRDKLEVTKDRINNHEVRISNLEIKNGMEEIYNYEKQTKKGSD